MFSLAQGGGIGSDDEIHFPRQGRQGTRRRHTRDQMSHGTANLTREHVDDVNNGPSMIEGGTIL